MEKKKIIPFSLKVNTREKWKVGSGKRSEKTTTWFGMYEELRVVICNVFLSFFCCCCLTHNEKENSNRVNLVAKQTHHFYVFR